MKNIIKTLFALTLVLGVASCEDEQDLLIISPSSAEFTTLSPDSGSSIVLDKDLPDNPALMMSWNPAIYEGAQTQINYFVEVDKEGNNFANPYTLGSTVNRNLTVTVGELNTAASSVGLSPDVAGALEVRIKATLGTTGSEPSYSNTIVYTVTPYLAYLFKDLYLVGEACAAGWSNNNNNPPMWRNPDDPKKYEYVGYFNSGGFKLLEVLGLWQPQWGQVGGVLAGNPGTQSGDPDTFNSPAGGFYKFTVDMNTSTMSYTMEAYTGSTSTTYTSMGLIGDATPGGWDSDTPMTQSTFDPHIWYISNVALVNGPAKFRANGSWTVNWGASTEYSGTGVQDGANIPVTGTNYNVWFNDLTGQYMFIPIVE